MTAILPAELDEDATAKPLNAAFSCLDAIERLRLLRDRVHGTFVFTTSFGLEDQVLTHIIAETGIGARFATLDTGRLFPQTYDVWAQTEARYGIRVTPFYPQAGAVENLVAQHGIDGFYRSKQARLDCCAVRKVAPLGRALAGASVWITGLRADQSAIRGSVPFVAPDAARGLLKANPLLDWTRERAAAFAAEHDVPINPLHAQGFLSIGCAPCTRAVQPGEPERAGRWWWEQESAKECGLHLTPDGRLVRAGA